MQKKHERNLYKSHLKKRLDQYEEMLHGTGWKNYISKKETESMILVAQALVLTTNNIQSEIFGEYVP